jgi:hypothetical protein
MNRRTKVLFGVVILAAGGFMLDRLFTSLWWEPWKKTGEEIQEAERQLAKVNRTLAGEKKAKEEWDAIHKHLIKPRSPDVQNHFLEHLASICDKVGVENNMQGAQLGKQGDFKEYIVDTKLKLTWGQYVDFLGELHKSTELLKPLRININSVYEKEERLDVDLRLSTIEFDPVPQKAGAK